MLRDGALSFHALARRLRVLALEVFFFGTAIVLLVRSGWTVGSVPSTGQQGRVTISDQADHATSNNLQTSVIDVKLSRRGPARQGLPTARREP